MDLGSSPRILFWQTAYLGDVVLSTPVFCSVKKRYPDAYLAACVRPELAGLLTPNPDLDEVLSFDKRGAQRGLAGIRSLAARIDEKRFDAVVSAHRSFRSALLLRTAGIPVRVGFADSAGRMFYTRAVKRVRSDHEVRRVLSLLPTVGINGGSISEKLSLPLAEGTSEKVTDLLRSEGVGQDETLVAVNPFSAWNTKRWPAERFARAADRIASDHKVRVVILGSTAERAQADRLLLACEIGHVNLAGRTNLQELAGLLDRCALLVTNDSGPMHIAAARGVPVVAVFGSTTPALGYGPFGKRAEVVQKPVFCRPCGPHGYRECPLGHFRCMNEITVDEVCRAAHRMLTGKRGAR